MKSTYKGLSLVTRFYQGRFQGKAWASNMGIEIAHVYGESIDDVGQKLRDEIDKGEFDAIIKREMLKKHGEFLKKKGVSLDEIDAIRLNRVYGKLRRTPHCYECSSSLDNEVDLECSRCDWIICSCGACGCGHPKYGPLIAQRKGAKDPSQSANSHNRRSRDEKNRSFVSFEQAKSFAQRNPGARIMRSGNDSWTVTIREN